MKGQEVKDLQYLLNGHNVLKQDFLPGNADGEYGAITAGAVHSAKYWLGYPLSQCGGGTAGQILFNLLQGHTKLPLTYRVRRATRVKSAAKQTLSERVLNIEHGEIGVKESPAGTNSGPRVRVYQATTGAFFAAWCASFQWWALITAKFKGRGPINRAYCPSWVAAAYDNQGGLRVVSSRDARPGDYSLYDWDNDRVADHIGLLTTRVTLGAFEAIEGNTAVGNDSNGGEVMRRQRSVSDVLCFIRVEG
jgi:hypothetical protein